MKKILSIGLLAMIALTAGAIAHEGHHQEMGTVQAVDGEEITLATKGDQSETFALTEETSFTRGKQEVTRAEMVVGERAVVMYETKDKINVAIEVKLPAKAD